MFFAYLLKLWMSLLTRGSIPGKIDNTNTSTHIAPTLTYVEKDPVSATDCNRILFPFYLRFFFCYFYCSIITLIHFWRRYFHPTSCSSIFSNIFENSLKSVTTWANFWVLESYLRWFVQQINLNQPPPLML